MSKAEKPQTQHIPKTEKTTTAKVLHWDGRSAVDVK
jgi:hypothetical protein